MAIRPGGLRRRTGQKAAKKMALRRGAMAERLAAAALRLKGYRIVARNFRCRLGEIDIVARKGDLIAFVEVKARNSVPEALDAVGADTQRRVSDAAEIWISLQPEAARLSWRFDIVAVLPRRWPVHFPEAF